MEVQEVKKTRKKPRQNALTLPYRIGHRVRVTLSNDPGDFRTTYGVVIQAEENRLPVLRYEDLSALELREYDRCVMRKEVVLDGDFYVHIEEPGINIKTSKPTQKLLSQ